MDETLAPHLGRIPAATKRALGRLVQRGVAVGIYSNASVTATPERAADLADLRAMGVFVAGDDLAPKPSKRGFAQAFAGLAAHAASARPGQPRLTTGEVVMVGDSYMTDGGAIRVGRKQDGPIDFVRVAPVATDERHFDGSARARLGRDLQRGLRRYGDVAADLGQRASRRQPAPLVLARPAP